MALIDRHDLPAANAPSGHRLPPLPLAALEQLTRLHAEQVETAARMQFLARTANAALALLLLAVASLVLVASTSLALGFAWSLLVLLGIGALLRCHLRTTGADFVSLADAVREMRVILFYLGLAWGTGAVLLLPPSVGPAPAVLFAVLPSLGVVLLLRDQAASLAFLAPLTAVAVLVATLRPWTDAGLDVALLVMLQSGIAARAILATSPPQDAPAGLVLRS